MVKSAKERQAEYRAKRKARGLCAYPGCPRKPRKYALCPDHREEAREAACERMEAAAREPELEAEIYKLRRELDVNNRLLNGHLGDDLADEVKELRHRTAEAEHQVQELTVLLNTYESVIQESGITITIK